MSLPSAGSCQLSAFRFQFSVFRPWPSVSDVAFSWPCGKTSYVTYRSTYIAISPHRHAYVKMALPIFARASTLNVHRLVDLAIRFTQTWFNRESFARGIFQFASICLCNLFTLYSSPFDSICCLLSVLVVVPFDVVCGQFKLVYLRSLDYTILYPLSINMCVLCVYCMFISVVVYWLIDVVNWCFSVNTPICMTYILRTSKIRNIFLICPRQLWITKFLDIV